MISIEEALERVLNNVSVLERKRKPILETLGQVLADTIYSHIDIPLLNNSGMDGYAVQWDSIKDAGNSQVVLKVIGEVAAGYVSSQEVTPGTAVRIMTGAPLPEGADTVVPFENTDEETRKGKGTPLDEIGVVEAVERGANVREAGEDITKGALTLEQGTEIRPQEVGVLASLGYAEINVIRRPVVAILATGDELVDAGQPLRPGKIYNSNAYSVAAQVLRYGGIPHILGIATDVRSDVSDKIAKAMDSDLLITTGGVSKGDYDVVKYALAEIEDISFWTVRMKPGKPQGFGVLQKGDKRVPHLGFPGNPVSSMVSFEQFARPAILKMLGKKKLVKPTISAVSESRIENTDGRRVFVRAMVRKEKGQYYASSTGPQGSGILTSMTRSNGLMILPEDRASIEVGDEVTVQMIDWKEER